MVFSYLNLIGAVLLGTIGQIVLKSGAINAPSIIDQLLSPLTLLGIAIIGMGSIAYIVALNRIPVSMAFPSGAAGYVIVSVVAHLLWNEPLGWPQAGGIALITSGIILINQN
jgi:multidrug transporter EmrE-like cation transporter